MSEIRPQSTQAKFLSSPADVCIYGGAAGGGKSWALLLEPLRHVSNPGFGAVIFRRTHPEVTHQGGLWDQSARLYPLLDAVPNLSDLSWRFRSGARVKFAHLQHEKNIHDWQGSEVPLIEFDELTHFTAQQFWYLLSRNRSLCGVRPYVRASCNPDADSWVAKLLEWWIDQNTGLPIPERAGVLRWCVRINDQLEWDDSPEVLRSKYPEIPPKSFAFIPAKLADNQILMQADPGYLANLMALPLVERERLLGGNWKIRPAAGLVFNRAWFEIIDVSPARAARVRYWDKAATPGKGDWSVGARVARTDEGVYVVEDVIRGQWSWGQRDNVIKQTAALDPAGTEVMLEEEGGSGGKQSAEISVKDLAGYPVAAERVTGDKIFRARGFSSQCEARNVKLLRNPDRDWITPFLDELHSFPDGTHDDQVDAAAGAFNRLRLGVVRWGKVSEHVDEMSVIVSAPDGVFIPDRETGRDAYGRRRERPEGGSLLEGMGDW